MYIFFCFSPTPSLTGLTEPDQVSKKMRGSAAFHGIEPLVVPAQTLGPSPSFSRKENLADILIRFETAQTQIAELRFKNRKLEEIISGSGSRMGLDLKVKELEESVKQYKTMKNYNQIIADEEFQVNFQITKCCILFILYIVSIMYVYVLYIYLFYFSAFSYMFIVFYSSPQ